MSEKNKKPEFAKYAIAAVAALLIIGVAVTTVMIKAKRKDVIVIDANNNNVENSDGSASENAEKKDESKSDKSDKTTKSDSEKPEVTKNTGITVDFPIDINKADLQQLCAIDGVGESTAQRILDYRSSVGVISSLDMLLNVEGIGKKTLSKLENYLYVADSDKAETTTSAATTVKTSKVTTASKSEKVTTTPLVTSAKQLSQVNINTADAVEISNALLISIERAQKIVDTREKIGGYVTKPEVLLSQAISQSEFVELEKYITI